MATDRAVSALTRSIVDIVGSGTRSVILHGSLATGGFRPGRSDIDLLAIVDSGLSDPRMDDLEAMVRQADIGPGAGIDLHVVTAETAATPTRTPPLELHVGRYDWTSFGVEVARRVAAVPDLIVELSTARSDGRALYGAEPPDVIGPVPAEWITERGRHWLTAWQSLTDDAENAAFMVLTASRIWRFAVEGVHCAKTEAGEWALARDQSLSAVRQALLQYRSAPAAPIDEDGIARVLDTVLRETAPSS